MSSVLNLSDFKFSKKKYIIDDSDEEDNDGTTALSAQINATVDSDMLLANDENGFQLPTRFNYKWFASCAQLHHISSF